MQKDPPESIIYHWKILQSLDTKEELIPIILIATLDLYPNIGNPERFVFETYIDEASNLTQSTNFLENSQRVADFEEEATLLCSLNKNSGKLLLSVTGIPNSRYCTVLVFFVDLTSATNKSVYICTVTPLFDIHLVGNQTYIVTFGFRHLGRLMFEKLHFINGTNYWKLEMTIRNPPSHT